MRQSGPWIKNKHYTLTIQHLGRHGEGIALEEGYRIFVPGGLPGDTLEVRLIKIARTWAAGRLVSVVSGSDNRVIPDCPVARTCGGCQIQHMAYPAQLAWKQTHITDTLAAVTPLTNVRIHPIFSIETPAHFRNKLQFAVGFDNLTTQVGLFAVHSHRIVDISHCLVQHSMTTEILKAFRMYLGEVRPPIYNEITHRGLVRHLVIRVSFSMRQALVTLVLNGETLPRSDKFIALMTACSGVSGLSINTNTARSDAVLGPVNQVIWGTDALTEKIYDLTFEMRPDSFFQTNPHQTRRLVDSVLHYAAPTPDSIVWDLYCGIGLFSLALAKRCKQVIGIELSESAIALARQNAAANHIPNTAFYAGDVADFLTAPKDTVPAPEVVVLDPPRKGCDARVLDQLISARPGRIIYVSCNPESLARDAQHLLKHGFQLTDVQPLDMFGHTVHLETVACFSRTG